MHEFHSFHKQNIRRLFTAASKLFDDKLPNLDTYHAGIYATTSKDQRQWISRLTKVSECFVILRTPVGQAVMNGLVALVERTCINSTTQCSRRDFASSADQYRVYISGGLTGSFEEQVALILHHLCSNTTMNSGFKIPRETCTQLTSMKW